MLLPGAGFGIAPSGALLAHVQARLPNAKHLELAIKTVGTPSRGTAETVLGMLRSPGHQRAEGVLIPRRPGAERRRIDFGDGDGPTTVVTHPWRADLVASVPGARQLETFMNFPTPARVLMRVPHGSLGRRIAQRMPSGPTDKQLETGRSALWARATDGHTSVTSVVHGPDAYLWTARAAAQCLDQVLSEHAQPGFTTPAGLCGPDLQLLLPGVRRRDLDADAE